MESSGNSSTVFRRIFGALFPFGDFFYILQQEEYSSARFLKWLPRFFFRRNFQVRGHLVYTQRVKSSLAFVLGIWAASFAVIATKEASSPALIILAAAVWILAIPLFVLAGNWVLSPYYNFLKKKVMRRAAAAIARHKDLRIVGVAGSFGKTTTKNFIYQFARYNYATQMPPGNINTPLGIAAWVNAYLKPGTQLLILEMDAYQRGEIAQSAAIAPADIAIVTNVGDQHLERFGSRFALAAALGEIFVGAKPGARLLCTAETAAMLGSAAASWREGREFIEVSTDLLKPLGAEIKQRFSASNQINLAFAIKAAQLLGVPKDFVADACAKLELPERRQRETEWHGYSAVDDSYNISLTTARAGLEAASALARRESKKLLVVTAGIPELGPGERDGNRRLGEAIAARADHAAILQSIFAGDIAAGIAAAPVISKKMQYTIFKDLDMMVSRAHEAFPPDEWVVLVQPELTDLYY